MARELNHERLMTNLAPADTSFRADPSTSVLGSPCAVIGNGYTLLRYLGQGGCATVYEACHPSQGLVAVKILDVASHAPELIAQRLAREADLASSVRHSNVLRVLDVGTTNDGFPFLAMELLIGEDVESLLRRVGVLRVDAACEILRQTLEALEAVHAAGIVHRDLKPNNLVLHVPSSDATATVKLIDFGIARGAGRQKLTRTGTIIGTPYYLAPEQAAGKDVDARADLWAVGVLAYEMLTGETPFEGLALHETLAAIIVTDVPDVRERCDDVPEEISQFIRHALRREPSERFQTAAAMKRELLRLARALGISLGAEALGRVKVVAKQTVPFELRATHSEEPTRSGLRLAVAPGDLSGAPAPGTKPPPSADLLWLVAAAMIGVAAWSASSSPWALSAGDGSGLIREVGSFFWDSADRETEEEPLSSAVVTKGHRETTWRQARKVAVSAWKESR